MRKKKKKPSPKKSPKIRNVQDINKKHFKKQRDTDAIMSLLFFLDSQKIKNWKGETL